MVLTAHTVPLAVQLAYCVLTAAFAAGSYQPPAVSSAAASPRTHAADQHHQQQQAVSPAADFQQQQQPSPMQPQLAHLQQQEDGAFLSPFGSDGYRTGPNTPRDMQQPAGDFAGLGPGQAGKSPVAGWAGAHKAGVNGAHAQPHAGTGYQQQQLQQQHWQQQQLAEAAGGGEQESGDTWQQLQWQVTLGNSEEWVDAGPVRQLFRKVRVLQVHSILCACPASAISCAVM